MTNHEIANQSTLTVSHDMTNTLTVVYLVSGTTDESEAIRAAELHTGLVASHADPDSFYDGFTVTLHRNF